jgi:hypothetical protein
MKKQNQTEKWSAALFEISIGKNNQNIANPKVFVFDWPIVFQFLFDWHLIRIHLYQSYHSLEFVKRLVCDRYQLAFYIEYFRLTYITDGRMPLE